MIKHTQKNLFKGNYVCKLIKIQIFHVPPKKLSKAFNMNYYKIKTWNDFNVKN